MTPPFTLWTGAAEVPLNQTLWNGGAEVAVSAAVPTIATPTVIAGTVNSGTTSGAITYANPAHQTDDLLLLILESQQTAGLVVTTPGWANVADSPRAQGTNAVTINALWKRATSSAETNPVVASANNHQIGVVLRIRGAQNTGDPFDFSIGSGAATATSFSLGGGTTTGTKRLILGAVAGATDTSTDQFSGLAGPGQTGFATVIQRWTVVGGGGGFVVTSGEKTNAGAVSAITGAIAAASNWTGLMMAIKPAT